MIVTATHYGRNRKLYICAVIWAIVTALTDWKSSANSGPASFFGYVLGAFLMAVLFCWVIRCGYRWLTR